MGSHVAAATNSRTACTRAEGQATDRRNFAFAMNIAAVVGTYSSIFVAAPLALWIHVRFYERAGAATAAPARGRAIARPEAEAEEADESDDDEGAGGRP